LYRWLHISDLHFTLDADPDQANMIATLLNACKNGEVQADFIVVTGDFHNYKDTNNYECASIFLQDLIKALGLDISTDLFLVPGNHDQEPSEEKSDCILKAIQSAADDEDFDYAEYFIKNPTFMKIMLDPFNGYRQMAANLIELYNPSKANAQSPESVHVRTWRNRINLLHLNSAILSDNDRGHAQSVDICKACGPEIRKSLSNNLPTLVLAHHSYFDLHQSICNRLTQLFNQTNVWAYLAGDKHRVNIHGNDYLIDRKIGISAWPNIIAGKAIACVKDKYSDFSIIRYSWDLQNNVTTPEYLYWEKNDSGIAFKWVCGSYLRPFPMFADINSQLYFYLMDSLAKTKSEHPSFQLMKIDEALFPRGFLSLDLNNITGKVKSDTTCTLYSLLKKSWDGSSQNHLMIEGEGGLGKTVALLSLVNQESFLPHNVPALYIPLHRLKANESANNLSCYIHDEIFKLNKQQYDELECLSNKPWKAGPRIVLLLDGFNEITNSSRYAIARDIEEWSRKPGVQIITASRYDIRRILPGLSGDFLYIKLEPLASEIIKDYLSRNHLEMPDEESPLWDTISYPLLLALYTQTETIQKQKSDIPLDWHKATNAGSIIWNFLQQELLRYTRQSRESSIILACVFATEYIAPYIAWYMVQRNQFIINDDEFEQIIQQAIEKLQKIDRNTFPKHLSKVIRNVGGSILGLDCDNMYILLTKNLNLFRVQESADGSIVRLMHQQFRDCLAAIHFLNLAQVVNICKDIPDEWQHSINYYVMNFIVDLIDQGDADHIWECYRNSGNFTASTTKVLLELQKRKREYDLSRLSFQNLDLYNVALHPYRIPEKTKLSLPTETSLMHDCKVYEECFKFDGHTTPIQVFCIAPNSQYCISASKDGSLIIWDILSGAHLFSLKGHEKPVNAIGITHNSKRCISASSDNTLRIWDVESGICLHILKGHTKKVLAVCVALDSQYCISDSDDNTLRVWDVKKGSCIKAIRKPVNPVEPKQIIHDGRIFVKKTDNRDDTMYVSLENGRESFFPGNEHLYSTNILCITTNRKHCVNVTADNMILVYDMETWELKHKIEGDFNVIRAIKITPDNKYCICGLIDGKLTIWNILNGAFVCSLSGHTDSVNAIDITTDGKYCVSASSDKTLRVWDIASNSCIHILRGHVSSVRTVSISPDGEYCISTSDDSSFRTWILSSGENRHLLSGHLNSVVDAYVTPDGNRIISASKDTTLRVWNATTGNCIHLLELFQEYIYDVCISSDYKYLIIATNQGVLRVWDLSNNTCKYIMEGNKSEIEMVTTTHDGCKCISATRNGILSIWDLKSGVLLHTISGNYGYYQKMIISPDNQKCITIAYIGSLLVWNINEGILEFELIGHKDLVIDACVSSDGKSLISSSRDGTLRIWDLTDGTCKSTLLGTLDSIEVVSITPDYKYCISGANDGVLRVWDLENGKCLHIIQGHSGSITSIVSTPDCKKFISGSVDETLRVWDIKEGIGTQILMSKIDEVRYLLITSKGELCCCLSRDDIVEIWNIKKEKLIYTIKNKTILGIYENATKDGVLIILETSKGVCVWDSKTKRNINTLVPLFGFNLIGANMEKTIISPEQFRITLRQNGVVC